MQNAKMMTAGLTTNMVGMEQGNALIWHMIIVTIMAITQQKPEELALKRAAFVVSIMSVLKQTARESVYFCTIYGIIVIKLPISNLIL